jgi:hypothetical protein
MSWRVWRWMALPLPASEDVPRLRVPRWVWALVVLLCAAVGLLAVFVPIVGVPLLFFVLSACGLALALSGTLRGLFWAVDTAVFIQRYAANTGWAKLQATPEGALHGVLAMLRARIRTSGAVVFQRRLWRVLIVIGGLVLLSGLALQASLGQAVEVPLWTVLLAVFVPVDSAQSIPLGVLVGLTSGRASSQTLGAALTAALIYCAAKGLIFALSASFAPPLGAGALLLLFALNEALLWVMWRMLHGAYDTGM